MAFLTIHVLLLFLYHLLPTIAEPVQYCRFGQPSHEADFCLGLTTHHNHSSQAHDLYLSITVSKPTHQGWTAIGTGPTMSGSLMFIVYGDHRSGANPIVSVRTVSGHNQPQLITRGDMGESDLRVLQTVWMPSNYDSQTSKAQISVVCYACTRWPGSSISASTSSQPWIWAWNDQQNIPVFSFDAHLQMHKHHAGNGGWGIFYVDMARSLTEAARRPSLPPLRPGVATLGTSNSPIGTAGLLASLKAKPLVFVHGACMSVAFLLLFPLGVVAMRCGSKKAFRNHWVIQLVAVALVIAGASTGLVMSRTLNTSHQWIGIAVCVALSIQGIFGWRHHIVFLRIRRRTWISQAHIWLGRFSMLGGWGNVIIGLLLSGQSRLTVSLILAVVVFEAFGLAAWLRAVSRRTQAGDPQQNHRTVAPAWGGRNLEAYFAVEGSDEEDENGDGVEASNEKKAPFEKGPRKSLAVDR